MYRHIIIARLRIVPIDNAVEVFVLRARHVVVEWPAHCDACRGKIRSDRGDYPARFVYLIEIRRDRVSARASDIQPVAAGNRNRWHDTPSYSCGIMSDDFCGTIHRDSISCAFELLSISCFIITSRAVATFIEAHVTIPIKITLSTNTPSNSGLSFKLVINVRAVWPPSSTAPFIVRIPYP